MAYVDVFGGGAAEPSDVSFAEYSISADLPLSWPLLNQESDDVFARIMHVTATAVGLSVVMPPANQVGNGMSTLIFNPGAESFDVDSYSGANLATVAPGEFKYLYITDNSTEGGSWGISAFGVGSSSPDASALSGQGLIPNAGKLDVWFPTSFIGGDYTIQATDLAHPQNVVGNVTITLPSSAAMGNGFWFSIGNGGTGTVTLQPTGADTINGLPSLALNPGETIFVLSFGIPGWGTLGKQAPVTFAFTQLVKDVSGNSDVTLTPLEASNTVLKFVGVLTGAINVIVPNVTAVYYVNHAATGGFAITVKTLAGSGVAVPEGARVIVECDGTDVLDAQTTLPSVISFGPGTAATPSITFSGDPDTGIYQPAANRIGFTTAGVSKMYIDATGEIHIANKLVNAVGAVGTPSYTFEGDENTGMYSPGAGEVALVADGVAGLFLDSGTGFTTVPLLAVTTQAVLNINEATPAMIISQAGSGGGLRVTNTGVGDCLTIEDSANPDSTPVVINASGRLICGYTSALLVGGSAQGIQTIGQTGGSSDIGLFKYQTNSSGPALFMSKSRTTTLGGHAIVNSGDTLGTLYFYGDDGVDFIQAGYIKCMVDGTPGVNDMPGKVSVFLTPDGSAAPLERFTFRQDGMLDFISSAGTTFMSMGGINSISTQADIVGQDTNFGISSLGNIYMFLDSDNSATSGTFTILTDGPGTTAGVNLFEVAESGVVTMWGSNVGTPATPCGIVMTDRDTTGANDQEIGYINFAGSDSGNDGVRARIVAAYGGATGQSSLRFYTQGAGVSSPVEAFRIGATGSTQFPVIGTTASAANAFLDSGSTPANNLLRSTSSIRYKKDVETLDSQYADAILNLRPVWYRSKCEADREDWSWYGLIAEEVAEVDPRLVHWTTVEEQLVPDAVQYERISVLLLDIVKRQESRIQALESLINV